MQNDVELLNSSHIKRPWPMLPLSAELKTILASTYSNAGMTIQALFGKKWEHLTDCETLMFCAWDPKEDLLSIMKNPLVNQFRSKLDADESFRDRIGKQIGQDLKGLLKQPVFQQLFILVGAFAYLRIWNLDPRYCAK